MAVEDINKDLDPNKTPEDKDLNNKTSYTKEEVEAMLQSETDKRVTEALKKQDKKTQERIKEAEKLAKMNEEDKYKYELDQREKDIAEKELKIALMENKNEASKILSEKGLSLELVNFIVATDADTMMSNINVLDKAFKASVKAEVEKRLIGKSPKTSLPSNETITKEAFSKFTYQQRLELKTSNPELYNTLIQ